MIDLDRLVQDTLTGIWNEVPADIWKDFSTSLDDPTSEAYKSFSHGDCHFSLLHRPYTDKGTHVVSVCRANKSTGLVVEVFSYYRWDNFAGCRTVIRKLYSDKSLDVYTRDNKVYNNVTVRTGQSPKSYYDWPIDDPRLDKLLKSVL